MSIQSKPVIGISCGDLNGIGLELIIKTFTDTRLLEICTPVIFASNKAVNFYRKTMTEGHFNYEIVTQFDKLSHRKINVFNCWEEEVAIEPGQLTETGGKYAIISLQTAVAALKQKHIDGLVTAPIHKKNIQTSDFSHPGHTPFLKEMFNARDVVMMMVSGGFRVALVTEHIPVGEVAAAITKEKVVSKLQIINRSLQRDFGIDRPRIAVLGLNPHAGDEGLIGNQEETIIKPAIKEAKNANVIVVGPYSADAFFARRQHEKFDCVLAMYHDQGLIPFKSLAANDGLNYTAGLPAVRTSPDHGTAFDIAGKDKADAGSFLQAIFSAIDIINQRADFDNNRSNPLKKLDPGVFARMEDEDIRD